MSVRVFLKKWIVIIIIELEIDLRNCNVLSIVSELLHLTFWYSNEEVVKKCFKIFNKIFGQEAIEVYMDQCP